MKFNEINTREDLSNCLRIPLKKLTHILYVKNSDSYYHSFEIEKKNGSTRKINAPTGDLLNIQKKLLFVLSEYQEDLVNRKKNHCKHFTWFLKKVKSIISKCKST